MREFSAIECIILRNRLHEIVVIAFADALVGVVGLNMKDKRGKSGNGVSTRPTISQVATAAEVSRSTVSRVFSRPESISEQTILRVRKIAAELGYTPNHAARALSTGRHRNIALIVPDVANPFFPPIIAAAQEAAEAQDYCVFLGSSGESAERELKLVERLSGQVEGMILVSSRLADEQIVDLHARQSLVLVNRDIENIPRVLIDSAAGTLEAVAHLAQLGHRQVAYISGPSGSWSNAQRQRAVRRGAARHKMSMRTIACRAASFEAGRECVEAILAMGSKAVIAFDDLVAQGVIAGLAGRKLSVPQNMSVIGCDDVLGAATIPPLTTVSNCSTDAGSVSYRLLMDKLESHVQSDVRYVMNTHLVVRDTTASPAGKSAGK